jgi:hypothetical protein
LYIHGRKFRGRVTVKRGDVEFPFIRILKIYTYFQRSIKTGDLKFIGVAVVGRQRHGKLMVDKS